MKPNSLSLRPLIGLLDQPRIVEDDCGSIGGMNDGQGNPKHSEDTGGSSAFYSKNFT
jgi:hypothetical protein